MTPFPTICKESGFDGATVEIFGNDSIVVSCLLFEGECSDFVQEGEQNECNVMNYVVSIQDESQPPTSNLGEKVVIVWSEDLPDGIPENFEVFASVSMDGGATFGPSFNVSNTNTETFEPVIAMTGDNVVVVWTEDFPMNANEIIIGSVSMDGGSTFGPTFNLSDSSLRATGPQIAMFNNNAIVVWGEFESNTGIFEIFASVSMDGGATFEPIFNISNTISRSSSPQVAIN